MPRSMPSTVGAAVESACRPKERGTAGAPRVSRSRWSRCASWHRAALVGSLLAVATGILFWRVHGYEFINLDDNIYVGENPIVQHGLTWAGLSWAFGTFEAEFWHPLTWLSYMLDSEVYGTNSGGYHLTNLWLHIAAILTLFFTLNRLTRALWRSAVVAALFAWHPLHVESVAWVAERKGLLSTVFGLLALWAYARYAEGRTVRDGAPGAEQEKRGSRYSKSRDSTAKTSADYRERHMDSSPRPGLWYALALLFFLFSLMSKPMLVTLPAVLLWSSLCQLRRIHFSAGSLQSKALLNLLREKLPFFVLSIAAAALAFWIQQKRGNLGGLDNYPFELRSANALTSYVRYLGKLVWPTRLAPFYPYPSEGMIGPTAAGGVLLLTVTWITLRSVRGAPYLAVGWLWFLVTLLPVIGWVQVGAHSMADRYTYVPMIGLFLLP